MRFIEMYEELLSIMIKKYIDEGGMVRAGGTLYKGLRGQPYSLVSALEIAYEMSEDDITNFYLRCKQQWFGQQ